MVFSYYAVFQYDVDGICVSFPDIPSALTCAGTEAEGVKFAKEALELALHGTLAEEVPFPSSAGQIPLNENQKIFLITVELAVKRGKLSSQNVMEL